VTTTAIKPVRKKPYATPKLVVYGTVSKLTRTALGSVNDGAPGGMAPKPG
jgi:hypothetical protein